MTTSRMTENKRCQNASSTHSSLQSYQLAITITITVITTNTNTTTTMLRYMPWSVTATARQSALAGCSSAGAVQAGGDGPPLSGTASPVVPRWLLCAGLHGSWSPASAIRQSPSTHCSLRPSQHFRRSCFRHCGPNSLEFSAWQFAWSSC